MFCSSFHFHLISHTKCLLCNPWNWVHYTDGLSITSMTVGSVLSWQQNCYFKNPHFCMSLLGLNSNMKIFFSPMQMLWWFVFLKKMQDCSWYFFFFGLSVLSTITGMHLNASFSLILSLMKRGFEWACSLAFHTATNAPPWGSWGAAVLILIICSLSTETSLKNLITVFN